MLKFSPTMELSNVMTISVVTAVPPVPVARSHSPTLTSIPTTTAKLPRSLTTRLYLSHFLSTWNSRLFEFGSVLFLASIYPSTLLPLSVYALIRGGAAVLLSPSLGVWIDHGHRLRVVRMSIVGQRVAVAVSCAVFGVMKHRESLLSVGTKMGLFSVAVVAACVEKLCSVMNLVSIERDWVRDSKSGTGMGKIDGFL